MASSGRSKRRRPFAAFHGRLPGGSDEAALRAFVGEYAERSALVSGGEAEFARDLWVVSQHVEKPELFWDWLGSQRREDDVAKRLVLVPAGGRWLCYAGHGPPADNWTSAGFANDVIWMKSEAPLTDSRGVAAGREMVAKGEPGEYWLRTGFDAGDPSGLDRLRLALLYRGSFDLYLNGERLDLASSGEGRPLDVPPPLGGLQWSTVAVPPSLLEPGENVLAVCLRRTAPGEKVYFECSLEGSLR